MKKLVFLITLINFVSCKDIKPFNYLKESKAKLSSWNKEISPLVYFSENQEFKTIPDLNRDNEVLTLSDQIVLSDSKSFLENKDPLNVSLIREEDFKGSKENILMKVSFFCSDRKKELENKDSAKHAKDLVFTSLPPSIQIIDLVPKELLSKNFKSEVYCTFVLKIKNKIYSLIQQNIKKIFFNKEIGNSTKVALLTSHSKGTQIVKPGDFLSQEELQNIVVFDKSQKPIEDYELFCKGHYVSSSKEYSEILPEINKLKNQLNTKALPCVFFITKGQSVQGVSPLFQVDFTKESLPLNSAWSENFLLSVYLSHTGEIKEIANITKMSLNLTDKFILSDPERFLKKNSEFLKEDIRLSKEKDFKGPEERIELKISSNCFDLDNNSQTTDNPYLETFILSSQASYINIIDLISKELIFKKLTSNKNLNPILCSFSFKRKGKTYDLIQQKIETHNFQERTYNPIELVLLTPGSIEHEKVQSNKALTKEEFEKILLSRKAQKKEEDYVLFCEGKEILSFSNNFNNYLEFKEKPDQNNQDCLFFSKKGESIQAISSPFKLDLNSFVLKKPIDFSEIEKIKIRKGLRSSIDLNETIDDLGEDVDYEKIDLIVETNCIDSNYFTDDLFTKKTRRPLKQKIPLMSLLPEELFPLLSFNYRYYRYRKALLKYEKEKDLKENKKYYEGRKEKYPHHLNYVELEEELEKFEINRDYDIRKIDLEKDISLFHCVFEMKLEEKNQAENNKILETLIEKIYWKRRSENHLGYQAKVTKGDKKTVVDLDTDLRDWINEALSKESELDFQSQIYSHRILNLKSAFNNLGDLTFSQFNPIDSMMLKCFANPIEGDSINLPESVEDFKKVELDFSHFLKSSSIPLGDLLSNLKKQLKNTVRSKHLFLCRFFFYSNYENSRVLEDFSPEINFLY
ncbi:MAG: hypothetical protein GDA46_06650 [Bdellovibrionales bacterium]|nr:hypothetical protein [Bdellovibrionales bacterium]